MERQFVSSFGPTVAVASFALFGWLVVSAPAAQAVPPPDFIFSVTSQAGPVFTVIVGLLSVAFGLLRQVLLPVRLFFHRRRWTVVPLAVAIVGLGVWGALSYDGWQRNETYRLWQANSSRFSDPTAGAVTSSEVDLLEPTDGPAPDAVAPEDPRADFIRSYYRAIGEGRLNEAYAVSKKSVPVETFRSWYENTTGVTVDSLQSIDEINYSLALTLTESDGSVIRYAVLMEVAGDAAEGYRVASSEVRIVASSASGSDGREAGLLPAVPDQLDWLPLAASNAEFAAALSGGQEMLVLDAREDEEYGYGRLPGSRHVRFADLVAGEWISLPTDRTVFVLCWSGIRGREVAEFLRLKGIRARYLEGGADGWVSGYGGTWEGEISFVVAYPEERYRIVLSANRVRRALADGAVLVDSRPLSAYDAWHVPGSYSFPVIYTPTARLPEVLDSIPAGAPVITLCDDFVSCFDARLGGLKLERAGHQFLGRFASPWELR
ncbi:MAG: rhodanese-like domain-containing protein [bacterium]